MNQGPILQVLSGRAALQVVVDEWIDEYKKDREKAIVELIQFFVQCCGCKGKLSQIMFASQDKVKSIRKLTESFDEESGEYPLIQVCFLLPSSNSEENTFGKIENYYL